MNQARLKEFKIVQKTTFKEVKQSVKHIFDLFIKKFVHVDLKHGDKTEITLVQIVTIESFL